MKEKEGTPDKDIMIRLKKIEGQVKGIEKMVENRSCCRDILIQVAAVRAAVNKAGAVILENYASECLCTERNDIPCREAVKELISTLTMFIK